MVRPFITQLDKSTWVTEPPGFNFIFTIYSGFLYENKYLEHFGDIHGDLTELVHCVYGELATNFHQDDCDMISYGKFYFRVGSPVFSLEYFRVHFVLDIMLINRQMPGVNSDMVLLQETIWGKSHDLYNLHSYYGGLKGSQRQNQV